MLSAARVHVVVKIDGCFVVRSVRHTVKVLSGWAVYSTAAVFVISGLVDERFALVLLSVCVPSVA